MLTLIENTVRVTMTHNESDPTASAAATNSCKREEAVWAERLSKPVATGDPIMAGIPLTRRRITGVFKKIFTAIAGNITAVT
jgi:hypothetical protein